MIRNSFHIFRHCKQIRGFHSAIPKKYVINTTLIQKLPLEGSIRRTALSEITVRFSSSNTVITETIQKVSTSETKREEVAQASDVAAPTEATVSPIVPEGASVTDAVDAIEYIPPPPPPPESLLEVSVTALGEPTLASYGLGLSWWPTSWMVNGLELLHVATGLPWWGSIVLTTVLLRVLLFPLVIKQQKLNVNLQNAMPKYQSIQQQMVKERTAGNYYEASKLSMELEEFTKTNEVNPFKTMRLALIQAPVFVSLLLGLRNCANAPVESFKTGGIFWFTDLTVSDPYYILPVVSVATLVLLLKSGIQSQNINKKVTLGITVLIPLVGLPFCLAMPSAALCYISATNFVTVFQVSCLKLPAVRQYFKIPERKQVAPQVKDKRSFWVRMKEESAQQRIAREVTERAMYDDIAFKNAGRGGVQKTYKSNPLAYKPKQSQ